MHQRLIHDHFGAQTTATLGRQSTITLGHNPIVRILRFPVVVAALCGQRYALKFSPALHRAYLRVLTRQKVGPRHARCAARGSGPGYAAFDRLRALRSSELQGRDEEQGLSGPNKEQVEGGSGTRGHGFTRQHCTSGEAERKRLGEEVHGACFGKKGNGTGSAEKCCLIVGSCPPFNFVVTILYGD